MLWKLSIVKYSIPVPGIHLNLRGTHIQLHFQLTWTSAILFGFLLLQMLVLGVYYWIIFLCKQKHNTHSYLDKKTSQYHL